MSTLNLIWSKESDSSIAIVDGRIDSSNITEFESELASGLSSEDTGFMMDLTHITFMSSAGLRVILQFANIFAPPKTFSIYGLSNSMKEIFKISGLDQVVNVYQTKEQALTALKLERANSPGQVVKH